MLLFGGIAGRLRDAEHRGECGGAVQSGERDGGRHSDLGPMPQAHREQCDTDDRVGGDQLLSVLPFAAVGAQRLEGAHRRQGLHLQVLHERGEGGRLVSVGGDAQRRHQAHRDYVI